jgi:hypothetical protein
VDDLIVASHALAAGVLTRRQLKSKYLKVHRDVYARKGVKLTARDRAIAAWMWSRGEATLVGNSAAALLGTKWIDDDEPAELARSRASAASWCRTRASFASTRS